MEFMNRMNAEIIYKKLAELEQGKEYEILKYNLTFVESLEKPILSVTIVVDDEQCRVSLPDKVRRRFETEEEDKRDQIIGLKLKYKTNSVAGEDGKQFVYYNVKFNI